MDEIARSGCVVCAVDMDGRRVGARFCSQKCRNAIRSQRYKSGEADAPQCTVMEEGARCRNRATQRMTAEQWCTTHYRRFERHGSPYVRLVRQRQRNKRPALLHAAAGSDTDVCTLVPGTLPGRLVVTLRGVTMPVARAVWTIAHGDPGEQHVLHSCPSGDDGCVTLRHLYLGAGGPQAAVLSVRLRGEQLPSARLTADKVLAIRDRTEGGARQADLAREFGVHQTTISNILTGKRWGWLIG